MNKSIKNKSKENTKKENINKSEPKKTKKSKFESVLKHKNSNKVNKDKETIETKTNENIVCETVVHKSVDFSLVEVIIIILITGLLVSITTGLIVYNNYDKISESSVSEGSSELREFAKIYNHIVESYIEDVDKEKLIDSAISGMYSFLSDEYSIYMDEDTTESLEEQLEGKYEGIGIEMTMNSQGQIYITQVFKNTAAEEAGLEPNDILVALDGESLEGKTTSDLASTIKKGTKTKFELTYKRNNEEKTVTVTKRQVYIDSVKSETYDNIGYIKIETFSATTKDQVVKILDSFDKKIDSLIIDVKDNTGGYLNSAYNVCDLFIEKGKVIYQLKDRNSKISKYTANEGIYRKFNSISVLINGSSASASEVLALALKESANATIYGTKSYGKGTVQETETLKSGAMVKYTTAYWLSPKGNSINEIGIEPDYEVADDSEQLNNVLNMIKK